MNKEIEISPRQIASAITDLLNENEQLHNKIDKAINLVNNEIYKNRCNCSYCNSYYLKEMKNILKDSDVNE